MAAIDIYNNQRIPRILELLGSIPSFQDPHELVKHFVRSMNRAYTRRSCIQISNRGLPAGQYRIQHILGEAGKVIVDYRPDIGATPISRGGLLAEMVATPEPKLLHDVDLSHEPLLDGMLGRYRSVMAVPVLSVDVPIDWVVILENEDVFTERDVEELIMRANLVGAMAQNLQTSNQLRLANAHIDAELEQIARIQRALLPDHLPKIPGIQIATSYHTFDVVGGDLYDFAPFRKDGQINDERWAFLIGDVSGHGPAAAVVMAMFHAIIHSYPIDPTGPGDVLRHVNRHLFAKSIENSFVTAFLGFYEPRTRE